MVSVMSKTGKKKLVHTLVVCVPSLGGIDGGGKRGQKEPPEIEGGDFIA